MDPHMHNIHPVFHPARPPPKPPSPPPALTSNGLINNPVRVNNSKYFFI